jgi:transcription initiation factor TFIID subunit 1
MGTTIVNYYRKKDDKDEHVPQLDLGQPSILNVGDAEPFLLGYVDKGKVTQIIHNNLIRAPIYRHTPETTDFLVIRHTVNGVPSYHIRVITNLYTVGQTFPNESEVPGPHARKNTNYAKIRLQIVAWLLIHKSKQKRIKMGKLLKYFPDQSELQMRQRLKIKGQVS